MSLKEVDSQKDKKGRRPGDHGGRDERGAYKLGTPRIAGSHKKLEEKAGTDYLQCLQKEPTLPIPWLGTLGLLNCEWKKMSVVSSYTGSGSFLMPVLGNNREGKRIDLRIKLVK